MFMEAFKHVCMFQVHLPVMENAQPRLSKTIVSQVAKHVCMYVSGDIHTYIHTCLSRIRYKIKPFACMDLFKNPEPVMKMKHTYMLKFLRISCIRRHLSMYVCLKPSCFIMQNAQPRLSKPSSTVFR